jgi:phage shock protein A
VEQALAPAVAVVISLATFVLTQRRAQQIDDRKAAKDTVELLVTENKFLVEALAALRARMDELEQKIDDCERERNQLLIERLTPHAQHHKDSTAVEEGDSE